MIKKILIFISLCLSIGFAQAQTYSIQNLNVLGTSTTANTATFNGSSIFNGISNFVGIATLASPVMTGIPIAPTASPGTNTTQLATTAFVNAAISAPASPLAVGTSLQPLITPGAITTTATSTINSPTITVTSASGLLVGMGIYASFAPSSCSTANAAFTNAYITNISSTTITMSCNATATNGTAVPIQFGQNRWSATSVITANDIGTQTLKVGRAAGSGAGDITGNTASWLNQIATGQDYRFTSAAQILTPLGGGYALTLGARTSDATSGGTAFPLQSFLYLDTWGAANYQPENVYLQDNLAAATAGQSRPHIQMEQSMNNLWPIIGEDPYSTNALNQTILHRYDCGTGQQSSPFPNNCTSAIDIVGNGAKLENGIVISSNALDTSSGSGNAISMPLASNLIWYSAANTYSATLNSKNAGFLDINVPANGGVRLNGNMMGSGTLPSLGTGFGTGAAIAGNGTFAFKITVGSSPSSSGVITFPVTAPNGWMCDGVDLSNISTSEYYYRQTAFTTTSATMTMYNTSATATILVNGELLAIKCMAF